MGRLAGALRSLRRSLIPCALALAGCGATTGVDVTIVGGDLVGADQVVIEGGVEGQEVHRSTVPPAPRAFVRVEDVRVIVPSALDGQILSVTGTLLKGGQPVGSPSSMEGKALLVADRTKRVVLCFDPAGCP